MVLVDYAVIGYFITLGVFVKHFPLPNKVSMP